MPCVIRGERGDERSSIPADSGTAMQFNTITLFPEERRREEERGPFDSREERKKEEKEETFLSSRRLTKIDESGSSSEKGEKEKGEGNGFFFAASAREEKKKGRPKNEEIVPHLIPRHARAAEKCSVNQRKNYQPALVVSKAQK